MARKRKNRKQRRPQAVKRRPAVSTCRDCGWKTDTIHRYDYFRAAKPRCLSCGGLMEYGGSWAKTRSQKS